MPAKPKTIDEYLKSVPDDKRAALEKLRQTIKAAAPKAEECISYGLPAFCLGGKPLVAFSATKNHCAFFPMDSTTVGAFKAELKNYDTSKGTIRFPADKPLPAALVRKLVKARVAENGGRIRKAKKPRDESDDLIMAYSQEQAPAFRAICDALRELITTSIPEATSKVWHGSPVWFIGENPVVGYNATAKTVNLLFWNGLAFDESGLSPVGKYGAAQATFADAADIDFKVIRRWLKKAKSDVFDSKAFFKKLREKK